MKTSTPRHVMLLFGSLLSVIMYAQENAAVTKLKDYARHFSTFASDYPQEKVYIHFDNTSYYLGENIWFKAYVVTAERNALSLLSKTLYVELVTPEGNVIDTRKLKIENGQCHGDFRLPVSNYGGFYEVRAFTRYMLNLDKEYLFSRVFPVYDKPADEGAYKKAITERATSQAIPVIRKEYEQKSNLALTFFPEGGNMVTGVNSKVAFKATDKSGVGAVVFGGVYDDSGQKVADINSEYLGMGIFEFTPGKGKYTAKVQFNNKEYSFDLPVALPAGYVMNLGTLEADKIEILIQKNAVTPSEPLGMSISCRGKLYAFEQVTVGDENAMLLSMPKKLLPSGVNQVTLYNEKGEILSERLLFVNHHTTMNIQVTQDKPTYKPYEKVSMQFRFADFKGQPLETTFSAAVHDGATSAINPYNDNLLTNLLLSSELRGYIENPAYYFESDEVARRQALDLLMLTQGWSRYSWKQMAGVTPYVVKEPIEKALVIEGTVLSTILKKKSENVDISMTLYNDSVSQQGKCLTDKEGKFNFALQDFYGQGRLLLESKANEKKVEKNILLYRNFSPELKSYAYGETHQTDYVNTVADTLKTTDATGDGKKVTMSEKDHMLQEILVKGKKLNNSYGPIKVNIGYKVEKELDKMKDNGDWVPDNIMVFLERMCKYYSSSNGMYKGKTALFLKDNSIQLISGIDAIMTGQDNTVLADRTPVGLKDGLTTTERGAGENFDNSQGTNDKQLSLLPRIDEIESISVVEDIPSIIRINPQIVDPTKVAIIVLHLKKNYQKEPNGMRQTSYDGYSYVKQFYSPQYNGAMPREADYRRTLYWNPDVKTDKDGNATIQFFNNSTCKTMHVSAETVTPLGVIGVLNK